MNLEGAKVLVTGGGGFIGRHVVRHLRSLGADVAASNDSPPSRADFRVPGEITTLVHAVRPQAVVNLAAMSRADECERAPHDALRVNADAVVELAVACAAVDGQLVHVSTDQVFDGRAESYDDDAAPCPIHAYGRSKAAAELALSADHPQACVLRPTLVFGHSEDGRTGASDGILAAANEGRELHLFTDEYRRPVSADFVARVIAVALRREVRGTVNVCGADLVSRYEFGRMVTHAAGIDPSFVRPSRLEQWSGPPRPPRLALESTRLTDDLGMPPPHLESTLRDLLSRDGDDLSTLPPA